MLKTTRFDLGEEIKSEIGNQIIFLLLFLFMVLAIFLVDIDPSIHSIYVVPVVALTIVSMVVLTVFLLAKGIIVYRWIPVVGLFLIPPMVIYTYHQLGILILLPCAVLIAIVLINIKTGFILSAAETGLLLILSKNVVFSSDVLIYAIGGIWFAFGLTFLTIRIILETLKELNKKYSENIELLTEARDRQGILNQLISERTESNIQLVRMNQLANHLRHMAEEERKIKEEFVARVSHELRTPLNMIIGYCTLLMETHGERIRRFPRAIVEDLEIILRNSQHLSNLINDILDLSQINAGQMAIVKEEVDMGDVISEAISSVQPLFESKHLYLNLVLQPGVPKVNCDRTRIVETLLNLLSNAGRFTNEGGVTIQVKSIDRWLETRVSDTGIGLSKQKQERLFDPFYQADGSIRRSYGGTGLGLSISKKIVELHHGRMWVESEEGKGAAFIFQLPIDETVFDVNPARRWLNSDLVDHQAARPFSASDPVKPRIVIVDKDGDLTKLLQRYSGESEYVPVSELADGVAEVSRSLSRLMLINTNQLATDLEKLRSTEPLPLGIPAILCSIPTSIQDRVKWDIFDVLVKPIGKNDLVRSISNVGEDVKTVLVVDDDPDTRRLLKRMLLQTDRGITVVTASNGLHGLQAMKRQKIDVILLDLVMPRMDGYQFLEAKKKLQDNQDIPVILISGHQLQERPIVSDGLGIVLRGGITIKQFLECLSALSATLGS